MLEGEVDRVPHARVEDEARAEELEGLGEGAAGDDAEKYFFFEVFFFFFFLKELAKIKSEG